MKQLFILLLVLSIGCFAVSQNRPVLPKELRELSIPKKLSGYENTISQDEIIPAAEAGLFPPEEEQIGDTRYDDQANASTQNRIYLYDDGTIGATWTRAMDDPNWNSRGTGYNYFDGTEWGDYPEDQIEEEKVGWPSYSPWGENGEIVVSHGSNGLVISTRDVKGTGDWTYSLLQGPPGHEYVIWNRTISGGTDHNMLYTLAVTASTDYSGTPYEGLDGAIVYSMSTNGGITWDIQNTLLEGMTADDYTGFQGDTYTFAEPKDDIVAFVVGESWYDLFLMKSDDGGETFDKTVIWEHPYPFFDIHAPIVTDTFYCADGANSLIIDDDGMVHVAFGINRSICVGTTVNDMQWFPFVGGIGYWTEDMDAFSDNLNALNPYGHPDSELIEGYNLIGWTQDVNGDGEITFEGTGTENLGLYYVGLSSMPQLVLGQNNDIYLVYSTLTETYSTGTGGANFRHLWLRMSPDGGETWEGFYDLNSDLIHLFDECVYPSCAANSDENIYLVYQVDGTPGVNIWGTLHPVTDNKIVFMKIFKGDVTGTYENGKLNSSFEVSQNYPNPCTTSTQVNVVMRKTATLNLEVSTLTGQVVYRTSRDAGPGLNRFSIDVTDFTAGVYFYTVNTGNEAVTRKLLVE
ncbi:MAG: T9SS type A sorting domain-containing protein [Bacteroidales bacterium]|nr:T9SS type A sorting domain-containing protein [Bacteroidales bacterium]